jgi:glutathione peroxidase
MKTVIILILTAIVMGIFAKFEMIKNLATKIMDKEPTLQKPNEATAKSSIYDFSMKTLEGKPFNMSDLKGKKIVILNVASQCGYTPQYADWEKFYKANIDKFVVLGFPANNFGEQEPGSNQEIATFCERNYGVTFPILEKISVKGADKAPIYRWLTDKKQNGWNEKEPTWNFCKYLVNEKGELTNFFNSDIKPTSAEFLAAIK